MVYLRAQPSIELMLDHYLSLMTALLHGIRRGQLEEPPEPIHAEDLRLSLESRGASKQSEVEMAAAFEKAAVHDYR